MKNLSLTRSKWPKWNNTYLFKDDKSLPLKYFKNSSPVERTGRFCTLIPKLLRGSSESSTIADWGGACAADDWTERAWDPSLELLLESLPQKGGDNDPSLDDVDAQKTQGNLLHRVKHISQV